MKLLYNKTTLPSDMDQECIDLCNLLNTLPGVTTFESCCGHCKYRYHIWFFCSSIDTLSRLGRATSGNYSDDEWEIIIDTTDTNPYGVFWLRSKSPFPNNEEMMNSVKALMNNILYWFKDEFDNYFLGSQNTEDTTPKWVDVKQLPDYGITILTVSRNKNMEDGIYLYDICHWTGKEFEHRTLWEDVIGWIPLYDLEHLLKF